MTPDDRPVFSFVSVDLKGAADRTGLSVSEIQKAIAASEIAVNYRGRKPLIRAVELDAWVASLPTSRQ